MFVGRETELQTLEELYSKISFQMAVIYGRRRVGKTTLISKFTEKKPVVFFSAQEANDNTNLRLFSRALYNYFQISHTFPSFANWNDAFDFVAEKAKGERFILVMDEFPYAVGVNKELKSLLQNTIDHKLKDTNLFIILCGSHVGFMEDEVLGYKSPLFGRRTAQLNIHGFDYLDASKMLSCYDAEDLVRLYACVGGTPQYLSQIDTEKSVEGNLADLFFRTAGYLYDEPLMLLKQELREPAMYNSIIAAIAGGASRLNDIATRVGAERSTVIKYLDTLLNLKLLRKEYPFGDNPAKSRKGVYTIADNCYRFWFRYVFPERTAIEQGVGKEALDIALRDINRYIGKPFEDICYQYMIRKNIQRGLPFVFTRSGRWWGNNKETKSQDEVDLVLSSSDNKNIILAECKWRNDVKDVSALDVLMNKASLFDHYEHKYYYLFSKVGFSDQCRKLAEHHKNVELINLAGLFDKADIQRAPQRL